MNFTARRISLSDGEETCGEDAPPRKLVYSRDEVSQLDHIAALVERARRAASALIENARETQRRLDARATAARRARDADAELALVARASALEGLYQLAQASLTAQLETTLDQALAAALTRIGAELPARQRLLIVCEQLRIAAGPVRAACLRLCEADAAGYRAAYGSSSRTPPWPVEIDDTLAPGHCKLTTDDGEWALDFDALMASLTAMAPAARRTGAEAGEIGGERMPDTPRTTAA